MGNLFLTLCSGPGALGVRGLGRKARPNYRNVATRSKNVLV